MTPELAAAYALVRADLAARVEAARSVHAVPHQGQTLGDLFRPLLRLQDSLRLVEALLAQDGDSPGRTRESAR